MIGCDFNDNIPLIGPIKGFALIEKYITIDKIKEAIGKCPQNYERSIQIFTVLEVGLIEEAERISFSVTPCGRFYSFRERIKNENHQENSSKGNVQWNSC